MSNAIKSACLFLQPKQYNYYPISDGNIYKLPLHRHLLASYQTQMPIWSPSRWDACRHLRPFLVGGRPRTGLLLSHRYNDERIYWMVTISCQPYSFFLNWMNCPPNILGNDPCNTCQNDSPSNTSNGCLNKSITKHDSAMMMSSHCAHHVILPIVLLFVFFCKLF